MNIIEIDEKLFLWINGLAGKYFLVDNFVRLVVNEYFVPVSLSLVILYLWYRKSGLNSVNKEALPLAFFSIISLAAFFEIINELIKRPRPFDVLPTNLLYYKPTDPSFPSNAAAVSFAMALAIYLVDKTLGKFALTLVAAYCFSRVYAGIHYPSDVFIGALLGIASVLLVNKFRRLLVNSVTFIEKLQKKLNLNLD